jgi:hypothetical protein
MTYRHHLTPFSEVVNTLAQCSLHRCIFAVAELQSIRFAMSLYTDGTSSGRVLVVDLTVRLKFEG